MSGVGLAPGFCGGDSSSLMSMGRCVEAMVAKHTLAGREALLVWVTDNDALARPLLDDLTRCTRPKCW